MGWTDLVLRVRALLSRSRAESDLDDELKFHLEMEARKAHRAGLPDGEARRQARADFGGVEQVRESCRDVRGLSLLENLLRDVRYGVRVLRKTPLFTTVAVISLAIGIGANTAIFSLVDTVLLRLLPVRNPRELVLLKWSATRRPEAMRAAYSTSDGVGGFGTNVFSWDLFTDLRRRSQALAEVFAYAPAPRLNVTANGEARIAGGMLVSGNYFSGLGVGTILGRPILSDEDTVDGVPAVVISYRFWERAFHLDPEVVGKPIYINRQPCVVVGVTPRSYFGISPGGFMLTPEIEISVPMRRRELVDGYIQSSNNWFAHNMFWIQLMGRMRPGSSLPAAESELSVILAGGMPAPGPREPKPGAFHVRLLPGSQGLDSLRLRFHDPLLILMAVVAMALLMTCANLAGLLLAKAAARRKEIALRLALGAGRARVIRQLLVEGTLLAAGGAAAGLLLANWATRALEAMLATGQTAVAFETHTDARVLAFTAGITLLTSLLFGLAPALRTTRVDLSHDIKQDALTVTGQRQFGPVRLLLTAQIAIALVLVAGAALFTRSLINLRAIPLGFNPQRVVIFGLSPGSNGYDETRGNQLYASVLERVRRLPAVTGATLSVQTPISGFSWGYTIRIPGDTSPQGRYGDLNLVGPDFFEVMQMPVILGRGISRSDSATSPRVAVISETAARNYFGGSPLGRRFRWATGPESEVEVVGVAKDAKYNLLKRRPSEVIYIPYTQGFNGWPPTMEFYARTAADPAATIAAIRAAVHEVDRMIPLVDLKTMEGQVDEALSQDRLFASVVTLFGTITLILACVGIYGLVSYTIASRTKEIGVRMALGASRMMVLRMVLGQVTVTVIAGLLAGGLATRALTRLVGSQLYGIQAQDGVSLLTSVLAVMVISIIAALVPARRATRIDPIRALRYE